MQLHRDLDGKYVILFRVVNPGAAALKLHFDQVRLPAGAELFVYGWNRESGVNRVLGPYRGAGPLNSGEFWTLAVNGAQAVVELHLDEPVAMLPFHLDAVAAVDGIEESAGSPQPSAPGETRRALFRGIPVDYEVIDGLAVWEGDILLGHPSELEPFRKDWDRATVATANTYYRWPGGAMPYTIDPAMANQARITDAVNHWNTRLAGHVRLVPRTTEAHYVNFQVAAAGTCSSYVGYYHYAGQPINIGDYCSTGNVIHEIGHALGIFHEHTRTDRDTFVQVLTANIQTAALQNFTIANNSVSPAPYDYNSIMHYGPYAFSANGQPTILTIPPGIYIGQRDSLSAGDVAGIKLLYPLAATTPPVVTPPAPSPVRITINSSPTGRRLTIDGSLYTAPVNFDWLPGSQHSLTAHNEAITGTRYTFLSWNDSTSASRSFTTPSTASTLTATYQAQHQLTSISGPNGSILVTPLSADGYYPAGSSVTLSAKPADAYCLASWTGILPVTTLSVNLQMTTPVTAGATFSVGSLAMSPWTLNTPVGGGVFPVGLTTGANCTWNASSRAPWITLQGATSGTGPATLQLKIAPNTTAVARSGIVIISQRAMIIRQSAR